VVPGVSSGTRKLARNGGWKIDPAWSPSVCPRSSSGRLRPPGNPHPQTCFNKWTEGPGGICGIYSAFATVRSHEANTGQDPASLGKVPDLLRAGGDREENRHQANHLRLTLSPAQ